MIKMNILLGFLCSIFIAASLSSCNDYDPVVVGYENPEEEMELWLLRLILSLNGNWN